MGAMNDVVEMIVGRERALREFHRLEEWWRKDASYRAPEDPLQAYALGNADAFRKAILIAREMFSSEDEDAE